MRYNKTSENFPSSEMSPITDKSVVTAPIVSTSNTTTGSWEVFGDPAVKVSKKAAKEAAYIASQKARSATPNVYGSSTGVKVAGSCNTSLKVASAATGAISPASTRDWNKPTFYKNGTMVLRKSIPKLCAAEFTQSRSAAKSSCRAPAAVVTLVRSTEQSLAPLSTSTPSIETMAIKPKKEVDLFSIATASLKVEIQSAVLTSTAAAAADSFVAATPFTPRRPKRIDNNNKNLKQKKAKQVKQTCSVAFAPSSCSTAATAPHRVDSMPVDSLPAPPSAPATCPCLEEADSDVSADTLVKVDSAAAIVKGGVDYTDCQIPPLAPSTDDLCNVTENDDTEMKSLHLDSAVARVEARLAAIEIQNSEIALLINALEKEISASIVQTKQAKEKSHDLTKALAEFEENALAQKKNLETVDKKFAEIDMDSRILQKKIADQEKNRKDVVDFAMNQQELERDPAETLIPPPATAPVSTDPTTKGRSSAVCSDESALGRASRFDSDQSRRPPLAVSLAKNEHKVVQRAHRSSSPALSSSLSPSTSLKTDKQKYSVASGDNTTSSSASSMPVIVCAPSPAVNIACIHAVVASRQNNITPSPNRVLWSDDDEEMDFSVNPFTNQPWDELPNTNTSLQTWADDAHEMDFGKNPFTNQPWAELHST